MNATTTIVQMPLGSAQHIKEIERLGFKYRYIPQYDITRLDVDNRRVQVREVEHLAPKANIKQYAEAMKGGAEFPAGVVTADGYIVDGNTRIKAALFNKQPHFHMIELQVNFEGASKETIDKLLALAGTLNNLGAQRLTTAEARRIVISMVNLGWTTPNIARSLGVSSNVVSRIKREQAALARMARIGLTPPRIEFLANAGMPALLMLNDEPYRRLVLLMLDAGLTARETKAIADELRKVGSDQAALDLIQKFRNEMEQRILDHALTGNGRPSKSARFRQALGQILGWEGSEADTVEQLETAWADHVEKIERAKRVLETALALQAERQDGELSLS